MARQLFSGKALKEARKEAGYTQEQLAVLVGISRETLSGLETEKPEVISVVQIKVIAAIYDVCDAKYNEDEAENKKSNVIREAVQKYFGF